MRTFLFLAAGELADSALRRMEWRLTYLLPLNFEQTTGLALMLFSTLFLPLFGWAIRLHFKLQANERRIELLEAWRVQKEESEARLNSTLQDLRLDVARLGALQMAMNETVHRIETRLESDR